jgi:hypothetical protein
LPFVPSSTNDGVNSAAFALKENDFFCGGSATEAGLISDGVFKGSGLISLDLRSTFSGLVVCTSDFTLLILSRLSVLLAVFGSSGLVPALASDGFSPEVLSALTAGLEGLA